MSVNREYQLVLEGEDGRHEFSGSTLMVAIDETGHEAFSDPSYPLFGLGGCAVMVNDYTRLIKAPWLDMKQRYFEFHDGPLHAAGLRPSGEQVEALGRFFRSFGFSRVCAIATERTLFSEDLEVIPLIGRCLLERIRHIAANYPHASRIALLFERSDRISASVARSMHGYTLQRESAKGIQTTIPIEKFVIPKAAAEPCVEVADFVMHAAGGQARAWLERDGWESRKDFEAVFHCVDKQRVSYLQVTCAEEPPSPD
jgi:Protein of unknown function (DUF3800)